MDESTRESRLTLSVLEAAELTGIGEPTLRAKIATGALPSIRSGKKGGRIRLRRVDVEAWLEREAAAGSRAAG